MLNLFTAHELFTQHPWWDWWLWFSISAMGLLGLWRLVVWWQQRPIYLWADPRAKFGSKRHWHWRWPRFYTRDQLQKQLPLFMRTLGSTFKAGYSVPQALSFSGLETEDPLQSKLRLGLRMLEIQEPLEAVLSEWKTALRLPEFNFLVDTILLQSRTGGNLVSVCYQVADMLEERQKLERDVRAFTAQGKLSGLLMALLWPVSLGLFAWLSPSHTDILFHTTPGQILLLVSLGLELVGFWFIWQLIRVKI